jgi:hypothetical protein
MKHRHLKRNKFFIDNHVLLVLVGKFISSKDSSLSLRLFNNDDELQFKKQNF